MIPSDDRECLAELARAATVAGLPFYVVGAGARHLVHDLPLGLRARTTRDWDVAVQLSSWKDLELLRGRLTEGERAPFRVVHAHRLRHRTGIEVDLIPFGGVQIDDRTVEIPGSQSRLSVFGFSACLSHCRRVPLEPESGQEVPVADVPAQAVLKAISFQDRRAEGIWKDLEDLDHLLRTYSYALDEEEVYRDAGAELQEELVEYEHVGAYLLARSIGSVFEQDHLQPLRSIAKEARDPYAAVVSRLLPGPNLDDEEAERARILARFRAVDLGLDRGSAAGSPQT